MDWWGSSHTRPEVLAVPGNGQVTLNIVQPSDVSSEQRDCLQ